MLIRRILLAVLAALMVLPAAAQPLREGWANPPQAAKPQTWWHWMNGNITEAGLTKDLEEMAKVGLGGAQIFNVDDGIPAGKVDYLSPEWMRLFRHAIAESDRLGLQMCFHNCAGWSSSGGPWVKPEHAMQKLVWTETRFDGPGRLPAPLAQPERVRGYYAPIAVLAFPTPRGELVTMADTKPIALDIQPPVAANTPVANLIDGKEATFVPLAKPPVGTPLDIVLRWEQPFAARHLTVVVTGDRQGHSGRIETSEDGQTWKQVASFRIDAEARRTDLDFPATSSRWYRLRLEAFDGRSRNVALAEINLGGAARIANWGAKAGFDRLDNTPPATGPDAGPDAVVRRADTIDLSDKLAPDGTLDWVAPAGHWTIMRFGHTCTGKDNHPSPPPGLGPEVDKMSREAVDAFWNDGVKPILDACEPYTGKALSQTLIDSYEVGFETWTARMATEFEGRRGYRPIDWLPAMTGRVVDSTADTERFLWDMRKTLAELFNDNYYGRFAELAAERGMSLAAEPYGNGNFDNLTAGGHAALPMTEFWSGSGGDEHGGKLAGSIAHTYEVPVVGAESFTTSPEVGGWRTDPWFIKGLGDRMWAAGVNRFIFHRYAHQPWTDLRPGMTMSRWGMWFEWPITWWEQAPAWTAYLARGQYLLQSGHNVADALYFVGDSSPNNAVGRGDLPAGYEYDCLDSVVLGRLTVNDGQLTLPGGARYQVLVLPNTAFMLPDTLDTIGRLVRAGATVIGPRPTQSPSLQPGGDERVREAAADLWGNLDGKARTERTVGTGRIIWGQKVGDVLAAAKVQPDVTVDGAAKGDVRWLHRRARDADIYYLACWNDQPQTIEATFRASGRRPELWHSDSAVIEPAPIWSAEGELTRVRLDFDARGSIFVVFPDGVAPAGGYRAVSFEGAPMTVPGAQAAKPDELIIDKAEYGVWPVPVGNVDVTAILKGLVQGGAKSVPASNAMAGTDPALNEVKTLLVNYTVDGQAKTDTAPEGGTWTVPDGAQVTRAIYGVTLESEPQAQVVDVTAHVAAAVRNGRLTIAASNERLGGDPAPLIRKAFRLQYRLNGVPATLQANENDVVTVPPADSMALQLPPPYELALADDGQTSVTAWGPGKLTLTAANGDKRVVEVGAGSQQAAVPGPWRLAFPDGWGAPAEVQLPELVAWNKHSEDGVQHFSGTATYALSLDVPAGWVAADRRVTLDLGRVYNFAQVLVNGRTYPVLWKPPFRVDITDAVKAGANDLQVRVTNLWANRLIGDERIDDGRQWAGDGRLLAWPQWLLNGQPKPNDGRYTFTTWRHYTADSPLQTSGMLGPVVLRSGQVTPAP